MKLVILVIAAALSGTLSAQTTRLVPTTYPTIQAAINAAVSGDFILVGPGIYFENLAVGNKSLVITSTAGAAATTIDGGGIGTCITIGTAPGFVIEGFTIRNGRGADGVFAAPIVAQRSGNPGGIDARSVGSMTLSRCIVTGNQGGRGADLQFSSPFTNIQAGAGGAGGALLPSFAKVFDCVISGNTGGEGGGETIPAPPAPPSSDVGIAPIVGNGGVGGLDIVPATLSNSISISETTFSQNTGGQAGPLVSFTSSGGIGGIGGLRAEGIPNAVSIARCVVRGNVGGHCATSSGRPGTGGAHVRGAVVENCLFDANVGGSNVSTVSGTWTAGPGALSAQAVLFSPADVEVRHVTIVRNAAGASSAPVPFSGASGFFFYGSSFATSTPIIVNSILQDPPQSAPEVFGTSLITTSNVRGIAASGGNINVDPLFVDPDMDDFHLLASSPCTDVASSVAAQSTLHDLEGWPRHLGPLPDMGAYERHDGRPNLLGTGEGFQIATSINGGGDLYELSRVVAVGGVHSVTILSRSAGFLNSYPILLGTVSTTPMPLVPYANFPMIRVGPPVLVLYDATFFGPLTASGITLSSAIPPGAFGYDIRLQAVVFDPDARNGFFAASDAHDLSVR